MAILVFQHHRLEYPARLGSVLRDSGHRLRVIRMNEGDPLPPDLDDVDGIVSLGGPMNVDQEAEHPWMPGEMELLRQAHERGVPMVGICLGMQLIAKALGGTVEAMSDPEIGWHRVKLAFPGTMDTVMSGIPWNAMQFHLHGQEVTELPEGGTPLAASKVCKNQAMKVGLRTYGFQYHFEWTRADIEQMLQARNEWISEGQVDAEEIRSQVADIYDMYRHLGDRLAENITYLLMPLDKRLGGRRGADESWMPN